MTDKAKPQTAMSRIKAARMAARAKAQAPKPEIHPIKVLPTPVKLRDKAKSHNNLKSQPIPSPEPKHLGAAEKQESPTKTKAAHVKSSDSEQFQLPNFETIQQQPQVKTKSTSRRVRTPATRRKSTKNPEELLELEAYGVNLWGDGLRPVLLLRSKDKSDPETATMILPVPLNALEAGVTLSQANKNIRPVTIHKAAHLIFQSFKFEITSCTFSEIRGQKQFVRLDFRGHPNKDSMDLAAEDAMSLCLYLEIPLYASRDYIQRSKTLLSDIEGLAQGLKGHPELLKRNHAYIQ